MGISKRWGLVFSVISVSPGFEIVFQPDGRRGRFSQGTTALQAAHELGVDINSICGGSGSCGKCIVKIVQGSESLNKPTQDETDFIGMERIGKGFRLACCTVLNGDAVIHVPKESRTGTQRLQTEGLDTAVDLDPLFRKRIRGNMTQILHGDTVIESVASREILVLGFAVDIGSTKLAGYLIDLSSGEVLSVSTAMNPQIPYGEDIITRLTYALTGKKARHTLHSVLIKSIRELLWKACANIGVDEERVYDFVFVGNTAMQHFLLDLDVKSLTHAPFTPENLKSRDLNTVDFNLGNPNGKAHVLPLIAGFVGADCVSAILATGVHKSEEPCFLIDIGTNTEIVVGDGERLVACSCASGPAFEGAHIKHGMRAASGAIESIWIDKGSLEPSIKTIDNAEPLGICGSGLIDLLSEMLKTGIMDTSGRINSQIEHPRIRKNGKTYEYVVARQRNSGQSKDITISQQDVRELQKGKAAMFSGAQIALKHLELSPSMIENVYMAGAFGTYINRESALNIGMIPEFNLLDIEQVGNAAGTGSRMALLSKTARDEAKIVAKKVEYIELAIQPQYNQAYLDALMLPHKNLELFPRTLKRLESSAISLSRLHKI